MSEWTYCEGYIEVVPFGRTQEEKATVDSISDFGKIANGISMRLAREILNAKCSPVS